jgi:hypothetical protein
VLITVSTSHGPIHVKLPSSMTWEDAKGIHIAKSIEFDANGNITAKGLEALHKSGLDIKD